MNMLVRNVGAAALALGLLAPMALPADAAPISPLVRNDTGHRIHVTMYGPAGSCAATAQAGGATSCALEFASVDQSLTVRAEILNADGARIGTAELTGTPRRMERLTVYKHNTRWVITSGTPRGSTM